MEQEIMQNANFEWLATLFVGIFWLSLEHS